MPQELNVVLATDELDIVVPPVGVHVSSSVGAQGKRGSLIFSGNDSPEVFVFPEPVQVYDCYLRVNNRTMYQYVQSVGGGSWAVLWDMNALDMFNITAPSDGQNLVYDEGSGKWVNQ